MRWDRHTLTAFCGIAALLISSAMLFEDGAASLGPIGAMAAGVAAIALAGLDRLKQRIATLERCLGAWSLRAGGGDRRTIQSRRRPSADRAIARPGMRRGRRSQPCRRARVGWSSPAGVKPRR